MGNESTTKSVYDKLVVSIGNLLNTFNTLPMKELRDLACANKTENYIIARQILDGILIPTYMNQIKNYTDEVTAAYDACVALPKPKKPIEFSSYVKKTYKVPTQCSCGTCKYAVKSDVVEEQEDVFEFNTDKEEIMITKCACNYDNTVVNAKLSGDYTKEEIMDELSVDEQGVCKCYEFGDPIDYDEIGDPLPESGESGVESGSTDSSSDSE